MEIIWKHEDTDMEVTQGAPFESFGLSEATMRAIRNKHYTVSTPVQAGCIPPMLAGKDVIAKAPTGTGKTMAFGIPIIERIDPESEAVQAVILAPTRELAMQITDEMRDIAVCHEGVRLVCLYGGQPIGKQIDALKKHPQIVVATPGRLSDHMKRRTVKLDNVKTVVLDEADRMLDMGFIHDVTRILDKLASRRNLGMFSATISREVMDISWMYQRDPEEITVQAKEENKPDIAQYRIDVGQNDKAHVMAQIIRAEGHERVMAFCNTKGMTERLKAFLMMEGLEADCIHGDIPQKKREAVMARFRRGELPIFVATDVAARGIDVDDVDAVFNYDVPDELETYARRIGRTPTVCQDWKAGKSEPRADQLQIVAAALGTTPAYLTGATDKNTLPTGAPSGEEDPLDAQLRELLSHADDDLKQAMIAFLERFQKK